MSDGLIEVQGYEPTRNILLRYVPLPLPGNRRHQWKTLLVLAALQKCRGSAATLQQLHTLVWALADTSNCERFIQAWQRQGGPNLRGYVPELVDTLRIMQVESLVQQEKSGRQKLTPLGLEILRSFKEQEGSIGDPDVLLTELGLFSATEMARRLGGSFQ